MYYWEEWREKGLKGKKGTRHMKEIWIENLEKREREGDRRERKIKWKHRREKDYVSLGRGKNWRREDKYSGELSVRDSTVKGKVLKKERSKREIRRRKRKKRRKEIRNIDDDYDGAITICKMLGKDQK